MRIAFLCKRRYMGKDVIVNRYARMYELPRQLALRGHDVLGLCLSYRPAAAVDAVDETTAGRLRWVCPATRAMRFPALLGHPRRALALLREFRPDVIVGASDAPHVALARWLARRLRVPYAVDLYDNFESFGLTRFPGMRRAYRKAISEAAVVSCTSNALADYVRQTCAPRGTVLALPSTVDRGVFRPGDKARARAELGLPADAPLVGTAGGLLASRGVADLYHAFEKLAATRSDLQMVLAGPIDPACRPPAHPRLRYLGSIAHDRVALLFQALDVGVIYLRDTPFGRYCFPQKAYEMLACGLPIVAASVGEMRHLMADTPRALYEPGDADALAACITYQLANRRVTRVDFGGWDVMAAEFDAALGSGMRGEVGRSLARE